MPFWSSFGKSDQNNATSLVENKQTTSSTNIFKPMTSTKKIIERTIQRTFNLKNVDKLFIAIRDNDEETIKSLLKQEPKLSVAVYDNGNTPLIYTTSLPIGYSYTFISDTMENIINAAKTVLPIETDFKTFIDKKNKNGKNALLVAIANKRINIVRDLVRNGASIQDVPKDPNHGLFVKYTEKELNDLAAALNGTYVPPPIDPNLKSRYIEPNYRYEKDNDDLLANSFERRSGEEYSRSPTASRPDIFALEDRNKATGGKKRSKKHQKKHSKKQYKPQSKKSRKRQRK